MKTTLLAAIFLLGTVACGAKQQTTTYTTYPSAQQMRDAQVRLCVKQNPTDAGIQYCTGVDY